MDKLRKIIKYNKQMMLALSLLVIIGIMAGSVFMVVLNTSDKELVMKSITSFYNNILNDHYNYIDSFKNVLISNIFILLLIWILGISVVGSIVIVILIFWKSFSLGFTLASFILSLKLKGLLLGFFYIFPCLIINLLILMYLSSYSIQLSLLILKCIISKKSLNFKLFMHNYLRILLISLIVIVISGLYEIFINPYILRLISGLI